MATPMRKHVYGYRKLFFYSFLNSRGCAFSTTSCKYTVRTRFAPSPTGLPHLGSLRTALYNYCFAKKNGGSFVLRLEDTDQKRLVPGAKEKLFHILDWAGVTPDEGPEQSGDYGPYIQSERLDIYKHHHEQLLQNGSAYRCFCSDMRLSLLKKEAYRRNETPGYDNKCRSLSEEQIQENLSNNMPYVIRLKMDAAVEKWEDLVFGTIEIPIPVGDPILIKTDQFPTYHFANVVDDHLMQITHVIRGSEWQTSTPKHLQLYKAFGWEPPHYAHIPLIMGKDGTKLSKRHGDVHVTQYQAKGYHPKVVLNFVTSVGAGFANRNSQDILDLSTLVDKFELKYLTRQEGRLDPNRLNHYNSEYLAQAVEDVEESKYVISQVRSILNNRWPDCTPDVSDEQIINIVRWSLMDGRIQHPSDLLKDQFDFIWKEKTVDLNDLKKITDSYSEILTTTMDIVESMDESNDFNAINTALRSGAKHTGIKPGKFMSVLRKCLTEAKNGPSIGEMMDVIGKTETLKRLNNIQQLQLK